jgi:hypothetical protein
LHAKVPILKIDISVSAIDIGISHPSMDNQQKKEHLMKIVIAQKQVVSQRIIECDDSHAVYRFSSNVPFL